MFYGRHCFKRGASAAIFTCGVFCLTLNLLHHYLAVVKKTDGEVPGEETRAQDPRSFSKEDLTFLDEMNNRMFKRKTLLKNACKGLDSNLDHLSEMKLLIYEKYKLAYCFIPKSGCSNMKKLMLDIEGYNTTTLKNAEIHDVSRKYLRKGTPNNILKENYLKLIMVRQPYERLVSSYNDKIRFPYNDQFSKFSKMMKELYGNTSQVQDTESTPSFEEFVKYVSDGRNQGFKNGGEMHWNTYTSLCNPCHVEYDVILHLETIKDDVRYLLRLIGAPDAYDFSRGYSKGGQSMTEQRNYLEKYFKQLTSSQKDKLYKAYEYDFKLFGYSPELTMQNNNV
ncbi:carbohydrate sulfotransferase 11-like [Clavelina lepadiformis]|uniref:carbohydrate sulfotransferase 11-like n=1 Tax=Clavelina lepadiformis TaxID=159417 RepID=UPI00404134F9